MVNFTLKLLIKFNIFMLKVILKYTAALSQFNMFLARFHLLFGYCSLAGLV